MRLDLKNKVGEITLNSGHSLILGHKPTMLTMEQVSKKISTEKQETQNLGLFDSSSPNYTTYYPDVKPEDLKPVDTDFIYPIFRLLSETIVQKGFKPIDFGKKGVLKSAMMKLIGQTINVDHEVATGNAIGAVKEVAWQNSYTTTNGIKVPAGINGTFKIDGKSNPRIARGIMMEPPSIHSNSVSVRFKWEQSHTFENEEDWWNGLGTYHKDGKLIRVIVTEIVQFTETSLVNHGADPYAQVVDDDGKIINPIFADSVYSFSADTQNNKRCISIDYKESMVSLTKDNAIPVQLNNKDTNNKDTNMELKEFIQSLGKKLGLGEDLKHDKFSEAVEGLISIKDTEIQTLKDEKDGLETDVETEKGKATVLQTEIDGNKLKVDLADSVLDTTRKDAEKFYKLSNNKPDDVVIDNIKEADFTLATSLLKQYKQSSDKLFPDICQDCNSHNISKATNSKDDNIDENKGKKKSNNQVIKELREKNKKKSIALSNK